MTERPDFARRLRQKARQARDLADDLLRVLEVHRAGYRWTYDGRGHSKGDEIEDVGAELFEDWVVAKLRRKGLVDARCRLTVAGLRAATAMEADRIERGDPYGRYPDREGGAA